VTGSVNAVAVYIVGQMINFHRPALWREAFTLRAPEPNGSWPPTFDWISFAPRSKQVSRCFDAMRI
jgi:hypothetical protein